MVNRDITIDILRGLAIFTMVAANLAGPVLAEPHSIWLRLYGTFAAPLFILISGMMVALTAKTKGHVFKYFLFRGIMIIIVGALIDVLIWRIYPFTTVDVLYLIGLSLPLSYLFSRLDNKSRWFIIMLIFLATPLLQKVLGYTDYPTEYNLMGELTIIIGNQTNIISHWLVDGWFPIFPWLGFSFLGVNLAKLRLDNANFRKKFFSFIAFCILAFGSIIWWLYPGKLLTRAGYSELFYPPTLGYIFSAIGLIILLFSIVDWKPYIIVYKPLQALGESALFMYVLHLVLIEYAIVQIWQDINLQKFLVIYIVLSFSLILIAYGLRGLKVKWKGRPFIIRVLLGG